ncbi:PAS domain S-box protein [Streptomyces sp. CB01881]|nr:hypothetical protein C2142_38795 [Streptomyces sp. CB01881]TYC68873.1 PAS domain S-box protein [Streptomyces sp. CB01881]
MAPAVERGGEAVGVGAQRQLPVERPAGPADRLHQGLPGLRVDRVGRESAGHDQGAQAPRAARFLPHDQSWAIGSDIPVLTGDGPLPAHADDWHPQDMLFAPMYNADGDLMGVLSVNRPRSGKRPGEWTRETLERFALQASLTIGNARLRAEIRRTLSRLEREHEALRSSEESFRQAFEYGPTAMAITELHGDAAGQRTRVNDALCRLLGQPRSALRQQGFADLVHPDDLELFQRISAEAGRADLRLTRRDGGYQRVRLRNSIVADAAEGPRFLMTVVEDMDEWKRGQLGGPGTPDPDHTMNRQ